MKALLLWLAVVTLGATMFGCRNQVESVHSSENGLSEQETEVLRNYFRSPAKVRQAAEICLQHRLTRGQVVDLMSDVMMIELGRGRIVFFYAPSQIMTMHYDTNGVIIRVKDAAFDISRGDAEKDFANK